MDLKDNIRRYRNLHEMTQEELAEKVGVSRTTVTQWESGFSSPRMGRLEKLADVLGVQVRQLLDSRPDDIQYQKVLGRVPTDRIYEYIDEYGLTPDEVRRITGASESKIVRWIEGNKYDPELLQAIRGFAGRPMPPGYEYIPDLVKPVTAGERATVPLLSLGRVHAGPLSEEETVEAEVEVPASVLERHPRAQSLIVEGDCMDRFALPGMAVVFDPDLSPGNGSVAIVETDDHEAVMRRWYRGGDTLLLVADSHGDYPDIVLRWDDGPIRVIGVVVWVQSTEELV